MKTKALAAVALMTMAALWWALHSGKADSHGPEARMGRGSNSTGFKKPGPRTSSEAPIEARATDPAGIGDLKLGQTPDTRATRARSAALIVELIGEWDPERFAPLDPGTGSPLDRWAEHFAFLTNDSATAKRPSYFASSRPAPASSPIANTGVSN